MAKDEKIQHTIIRQALILFIILFFMSDTHAEQRTENGFFTVEVIMEKEDLKVGENKPMRLILRDTSGNPIERAGIKAALWMTEHGHGSSRQARVEEKGKGLYIIEDLYLTMKGKWGLIIEIKHKGKEDAVAITLPKIN